MPYIFGKLWHLAIIWAIRKAFQCILQGVRILLSNHTRISPTSENDSYIDFMKYWYEHILTSQPALSKQKAAFEIIMKNSSEKSKHKLLLWELVSHKYCFIAYFASTNSKCIKYLLTKQTSKCHFILGTYQDITTEQKRI